MYQLIWSIAEISAQECILEAAAEGEGAELSFTRVLQLAEAFKIGRANQ